MNYEPIDNALIICVIIFILAIWKVVEILLWAMGHIRIGIV